MKRYVYFIFAIFSIVNIFPQKNVEILPLEQNLVLILNSPEYNSNQLIKFYNESKKTWGKYGEISILKKLVQLEDLNALRALVGTSDFMVRDVYDEDIRFWALRIRNWEIFEFFQPGEKGLLEKNKYGNSLFNYLEFYFYYGGLVDRKLVSELNYSKFESLYFKIFNQSQYKTGNASDKDGNKIKSIYLGENASKPQQTEIEKLIWNIYSKCMSNPKQTQDFSQEIEQLKKYKDIKLVGPFYVIDILFKVQNYELTTELLRLGLPCYAQTFGGMQVDLIDPLYDAVLSNRSDLVSVFSSEHGKNPMERIVLTRAAYQAAGSATKECLIWLLRKGAEVDVLTRIWRDKDANGGQEPADYLYIMAGPMGSGSLRFYPFEYKNRTILNAAVNSGDSEKILLMLDFGADPYTLYTQNEMSYIYHELTAEEKAKNGNDYSVYKIEVKNSFEGDAFLQTNQTGGAALAGKMKDYLSGSKLPNYLVYAIQIAFERNDLYQLDDLARYVAKKQSRYCPRDRKLFRKLFYTLGNKAFNQNDFKTALEWYKKGIIQAEENIQETSDFEQLKKMTLESWERSVDGDTNGSPAFQAYNIACCYAKMKDIDTAFNWLKIAIRLDPKTKEFARTDSDLATVREKYGTEF